MQTCKALGKKWIIYLHLILSDILEEYDDELLLIIISGEKHEPCFESQEWLIQHFKHKYVHNA